MEQQRRGEGTEGEYEFAEDSQFPLASLTGIQFGLLTAKEIRKLSVWGDDVTRTVTRKDLLHPDLGIPHNSVDEKHTDEKGKKRCNSCNAVTRKGCDGHFGHIPLPTPVYHPLHVPRIRHVLSAICLNCGRYTNKKNPRAGTAETQCGVLERNAHSGVQEHSSTETTGRAKNLRRATENDNGDVRSLHGSKRKRVVNGGALVGKKRKRSEDMLGTDTMPVSLPKKGARSQEPRNLILEVSDMESSEPDEVPVSRQQHAKKPGNHDSNANGDSTPIVPDPAAEQGCKYCREAHYTNKQRVYPKLTVKAITSDLGRKGKLETLEVVVDEKALVVPPDLWDFIGGHPEHNYERSRHLLPQEVLNMLKKVPQEDIEKVGMHKIFAKPEGLVLKWLPLSPNCNRLAEDDWSSSSNRPGVFHGRQDARLESIISKIRAILGYRTKQEMQCPTGKEDSGFRTKQFHEFENDGQELQVLVARHMRAFKTLEFGRKQVGESKDAGASLDSRWMKNNILAKRSNYSARSVVTGDPCMPLGAIGVPEEIARRLTISERVNKANFRILQACVRAGSTPDAYNIGAFQVIRKGQTFDLGVRGNCQLQVGDTVLRYLRNGDYVLANRPPSVHKHSLIALKVQIHPLSTFLINPLLCAPFGADFDGDAFHIFLSQSLESVSELRELMTVPKQMISPQGGQALLTLTQDSLLGGHLLTSMDAFFSKKDMNQMNMWCSGKVLKPAIVKSSKGPYWTGKQIFSMTLPEKLNHRDENVSIRDGEILLCSGESGWLHNPVTGIVRVVAEFAGSIAAVDHLDAVQAVVNAWLASRSFSVGLGDFYVAENSKSRREMLGGMQKSLFQANQAALVQTIKLDKELQMRLLFPQKFSAATGVRLEHHGCFGLLLGDPRSSLKIKALQHAALKKFLSSLAPLMKNIIEGYMGRDNSLVAMIKSGSKGSFAKLSQQVGCVGLQTFSGVDFLPVKCHEKPFYFQQSLKYDANEIFTQVEQHAVRAGYWESRGIVASSYLDGTNPLEFFLHAMSARFLVMRQGVEGPNQLLRSLMLFLRDLQLGYDGTVRNLIGQRIVQFKYGGVNMHGRGVQCSQDTDDSGPHWEDSVLAGEPVGALAATAITEPAYGYAMETIHRSQPLGADGPMQRLQETLLPRSQAKQKVADRTVVLRLIEGFSRERKAILVQSYLQKVPLKMVTLSTMIEYKSTETFKESKQNEEDDVDDLTRRSPWIGHLHMCQELLGRYKLDERQIVNLLRSKFGKGTKANPYRLIIGFSVACCHLVPDVASVKQKQSCICFFPHVSLGDLQENDLVYNRKMYNLLELIKRVILPDLLQATVRGNELIEQVNIAWEDDNCSSCLPSTSSVHYSSSGRQLDRKGELVLEVIVAASKGSGKRGKAWNTVKEACVQVMDMIDWMRSSPYSIQEIYHSLGLEAAHQFILKRLTLAIKVMGKPVRMEHLNLVADMMTNSGQVTGLSLAGYRDFCRQIRISTPFTEAAFQGSRRTFLDVAAKGGSDSLAGVLASAVWGKRIPVGTAKNFDLIASKEKDPEFSQKLGKDPLDTLAKLKMLSKSCSLASKQNNVRKGIKLHRTAKLPAHIDGKASNGYMATMRKTEGSFAASGYSRQGQCIDVLRSIGERRDKLRCLLHGRYKMGDKLNAEAEMELLNNILWHHPNKEAKIGCGVDYFKIGSHPQFPETRCFIIVRKDGSVCDFSYRKCLTKLASDLNPSFGSVCERFQLDQTPLPGKITP